MLGMSLFLGSVILSGSQRQSEKQSESDILHFIFFLSHLDPILLGSFSLFLRYAWNEPFFRFCNPERITKRLHVIILSSASFSAILVVETMYFSSN